jgi:hypothetical protein
MQITTKFYLGIDVSKHWFDLSLLTVINHQKQVMTTERFDNNETGIKEMGQWLKKQNVSYLLAGVLTRHSLIIIYPYNNEIFQFANIISSFLSKCLESLFTNTRN